MKMCFTCAAIFTQIELSFAYRNTNTGYDLFRGPADNITYMLWKCFFYTAGFPVVMVTISLSIAAGKEGVNSYINDK